MNTPLSPQEYAALVASAAASAERALDEARIPIHILLTAQFGELNDNQEEMLGAAQGALDRVAQELRTVRTIADSDRGAARDVPATVRVADMLRALEPELRSQASRAGITLTLDIEPALPSASGSGPHVRDALRLTLADEIRYAMPGTTVAIQGQSTPEEVLVTSRSATARSVSDTLMLASHLLSAQGGRLEHNGSETTIALPRASAEVTRAA